MCFNHFPTRFPGCNNPVKAQTLCLMKKQIKKRPVDFKTVKIEKKQLKEIKGGNVIEEDIML